MAGSESRFANIYLQDPNGSWTVVRGSLVGGAVVLPYQISISGYVVTAEEIVATLGGGLSSSQRIGLEAVVYMKP